MAEVMTCPECGVAVRFMVDGRSMYLDALLALRFAPLSIERRMYHDLRCTRYRPEVPV